MKKLKIIMAGMETYTGFVGMVEFENGISKTPVPQIISDRISGVITMMEIDEDGSEQQANPAARITSHMDVEAPVIDASSRSSDEELLEERRRDAINQLKAPTDRFYTLEELEGIAERSGIAGIREIANLWNVRDRSIPKLITEVLRAQAAFNAKVEAAVAALPSPPTEIFAHDATVEGFIGDLAATPTDETAEAGFIGSGDEVPATEAVELPPVAVEPVESIEDEPVDLVEPVTE